MRRRLLLCNQRDVKSERAVIFYTWKHSYTERQISHTCHAEKDRNADSADFALVCGNHVSLIGMDGSNDGELATLPSLWGPKTSWSPAITLSSLQLRYLMYSIRPTYITTIYSFKITMSILNDPVTLSIFNGLMILSIFNGPMILSMANSPSRSTTTNYNISMSERIMDSNGRVKHRPRIHRQNTGKSNKMFYVYEDTRYQTGYTRMTCQRKIDEMTTLHHERLC
jgi:hypothetical protein